MDMMQLLNLNESLKNNSNHNSTIISNNQGNTEILKSLVEKLIETKHFENSQNIVSSGHPGFANAYKIQGVSAE